MFAFLDDSCLDTTFEDVTYQEQDLIIGYGEYFELAIKDSVSQSNGDLTGYTYCGARTFTT